MKYVVIKKDSVGGFEREVNKFLEAGWQMHGTMTVLSGTVTFWYFQAMIKGDNNG
jgi:hypothetical protein